jgi:OmpA-OmpF porin, OOP family
MSNFLIDSITDVLRSGSLGTVASQLGQSEQQITRGMQMGVASIGAGIATKTNDPGFMRQLFDMATTHGVDPARVVSDPSVLTAKDGSGTQFLTSVFGNNAGAVTGAIASATGMRPEATSSMLGMASTLVLGVLGSRIKSSGLTLGGLTEWLGSQRDSLLREAPAPLRALLGVAAPSAPGVAAPAVGPATGAVLPRPAGARPDRWLWPAIAAILVLGVVWNVLRGNHATTVARTPVVTTPDTASAAGEVARPDSSPPSSTAMVTQHLPNGTDLLVPNSGTETNLIAYLQDPTKTGKDTTWFDFDRLLFETNSAKLAPSSNDQLHDVAVILVAYPKTHATIGGYTDNTGDADANMKLSQDRAASVVTELITLGVPGNQLTSKGYGDTHPVADNGTAVGRAQNRRIAIRVTSK